MRLTVAAAAAMLVVVTAQPRPAEAGLGVGAGAELVDGRPVAVVVVGRDGPVASWSATGARGGPTWTCRYFEWEADAAAPVKFAEEPTTPRAGRLYLFTCVTASGALAVGRLVVFDPGDPFAGVAAAERALDEARRRLDLPIPRPALNPPQDQLVGVPTWLWLDDAWQPASATAAIGGVASTVTATPVRATWSMDDGTSVTCGSGVAYDPGRLPSEQSSDCTHVYVHDSSGLPEGAYVVSVRIDYDVGWTATTGASGVLEALTTQVGLPVVVRQAQAVIR